MASGFFLGGAAEGMKTAEDIAAKKTELGLSKDRLAQELALQTRGHDLTEKQLGQNMTLQTRQMNIQEQGQKNQMYRDMLTRADKQVDDTMALVGETVSALVQSGKDPDTIAKTVQPLIQSAKSIAQKGGRDPASLDAKLSVMIAKPAGIGEFKKTGQNSFGNDTYGFVNPTTGTVTAPNASPSSAPTTAAPAAPQSSSSAEPEATPTTGDAFLNSLPPEVRSLVKQVAEYSVRPQDLSIKGGHRERILAAAQQYDPTYDSLLAPARAAAIKEFNSGGNSSPAGQIKSGNTAIKHLGDVSDAAEEVKALPGVMQGIANAGVPFLSYAAAAAKNASVRGTPEGAALAKFLTAANHFSEEVTKFYAGSGGSEAERDRALSNLNAAKSLPELRAAIAQEAKLMKGNVDSLQQRWHQALGPKAFERKLGEGDFPLVHKEAQLAFDKVTQRMGAKATPASPDGSAIPSPPAGFVMTR